VKCRVVQASVPLFIPVKQIAIVLEQDVQTFSAVVSDSREKRCRSIFISTFYQIIDYTEFTKQSCYLLVTITDTVVKSVTATLIFDVQISF